LRAAPPAEYDLCNGQQERQDQGKLTKLRDHRDTLAGVGVCSDAATSGGM
jgi:hypothetical protein